MKVLNKHELQQSALNHLSGITFEKFLKIYRKNTTEPYSFLADDTLPSDKPHGF